MPGVRAQLGDPPENQRLVGRLLGVLAERDDPARIERTVHVVMTAVHVEGMLGQGPGRDFQHHRRAFAWRVVVLLHAIHHPLSGGVIDDALAAHRMGDCPALGRVLAFRFDGDRVQPENIEFAFGVGLLVQLSAFG